MKKFTISFCLFLLSLNGIAQVCFAPVANYTLGGQPISVVSDDFNNDGNNDLAVVRETSNDIAILFGNASGIFTLNSTYAVGGSLPVSVVSKDFNSDGQEDLAVAVNASNIVRILYGSNSGTFVLGPSYGVGASPFEVAVADFNNDTKADFISANYTPNQVSIYFGTGAGTFTGGVGVGVSTQPAGVFCADFNSDGNMDFVTTNSGANNISIKLGNGAGIFSGSATFNVGSSPREVDGGDLNGDGILDLVVSNISSGNVSVLLGVGSLGIGTGSFFPAVNYVASTSPNRLKLSDINGDAKLDIVIPTYSNTSMGNLAILLGSGSGTFSGPILFPVGPYACQVCCKDFNNDGRMDIANASVDPPYITSVYLNQSLMLTPRSQTICNGNSTVLTASGVTTYTWNTGANTSSIVITPSATMVYTVIGTNSLSCLSALFSTVVVNPTPTLTVNSATICAGDPTILSVSGASTYTWNTGPNSSSIAVSPIVATNYTVIGTSTNGCISSASSSVIVNPIPLVFISPSSPQICTGESATLTASGANTYTWNNSTTGNNLIVTPSISTSYTIRGTDANNCKGNFIFALIVNPTPTLGITGSTFVCANSNAFISASGANTYTWSNGANSSNINVTPSVTTIYTVIGANSYSCTDNATLQVNTTSLVTPSICLITVDSLSINNEIYWEKINYPQADTFIVYRESSASLYKPIARIPKNAFSSYIDTNRSIGPNNGNPNFTSYKYKLQYRDSCGNLSALSPFHKTIFILDYQTGNFSWNYYNIEGIGDLLTVNYNLWRQSVLTGTSVMIGGTSGTAFTDPNYSSFALGGNVKWYVSTSGFNCNPSLKSSGSSVAGKTGTKSNNSNEKQFPATLGLNNSLLSESNFKIYPNPAQDKFTVSGEELFKCKIDLTDILGRHLEIPQVNETNTIQFDVSDLKQGMYLLRISRGKESLVKKVLVE